MRTNIIERLSYEGADFHLIQSVLLDHAGIKLNEGKRELVYGRLAKRVRGLGLSSFADYCNILQNDRSEVLTCTNLMTTNVTSFFREEHHFKFLTKKVLGCGNLNENNCDISIWSAGCSTGQEPYSIAFTCYDYLQTQLSTNVTIAASDLDSQVLQKAARGVYSIEEVSTLSHLQLQQWFLRGKRARTGHAKVKDEIQQLISFSQINLNNDWIQEEKFDVIFCRNVMIYFNTDLKNTLIDKFYSSLKPNGYLILGHSESLFGMNTKFKVVGRTIHQKVQE